MTVHAGIANPPELWPRFTQVRYVYVCEDEQSESSRDRRELAGTRRLRTAG